jgi:hypothetical protein
LRLGRLLLVVAVALFLELSCTSKTSELRVGEGSGLDFGEELWERFCGWLGGSCGVDVEGFDVLGAVF